MDEPQTTTWGVKTVSPVPEDHQEIMGGSELQEWGGIMNTQPGKMQGGGGDSKKNFTLRIGEEGTKKNWGHSEKGGGDYKPQLGGKLPIRQERGGFKGQMDTGGGKRTTKNGEKYLNEGNHGKNDILFNKVQKEKRGGWG